MAAIGLRQDRSVIDNIGCIGGDHRFLLNCWRFHLPPSSAMPQAQVVNGIGGLWRACVVLLHVQEYVDEESAWRMEWPHTSAVT